MNEATVANSRASERLGGELRALASEVSRCAARVGAAAKGAPDAEAVHDFRVALRRLRTLLRPARDVFGERRSRAVAGALREVARATGDARDDEVLRETLAALRLGAAARAAVSAWIARRERFERMRRARALRFVTDETHLSRALADVSELARRSAKTDEEAIHLARRALASAARDVEELERPAIEDARAAALHELRIRYKRLRYLAEFFSADIGEGAEATAKRAAKMQKRLGEVHDLDVALARVARARSLPLTTRRAVLGALVRARRALVAALAASPERGAVV